jgi:hypothetical protein
LERPLCASGYRPPVAVHARKPDLLHIPGAVLRLVLRMNPAMAAEERRRSSIEMAWRPTAISGFVGDIREFERVVLPSHRADGVPDTHEMRLAVAPAHSSRCCRCLKSRSPNSRRGESPHVTAPGLPDGTENTYTNVFRITLSMNPSWTALCFLVTSSSVLMAQQAAPGQTEYERNCSLRQRHRDAFPRGAAGIPASP